MELVRRHLVRLTQVSAAVGRSWESENMYKAQRYASWSELGTQHLTGALHDRELHDPTCWN